MPPLDRVVLAGEHVRLEPLLLQRAEGLPNAADESRRTYALCGVPLQPVPATLPEARRFIEMALAEEEHGQSLAFTVFAAGGEIVGTTRYMTIEWWRWPGPPLEPVPVGPDVLEIGWTWYAERVQRTAVNTESKLLLCTHAFEKLRVRRVSWKTDARNERSRAAILRLGARFDGILRAHRVGANGAVRDRAYYSMLSTEWPEAKRGLREKLARHA